MTTRQHIVRSLGGLLAISIAVAPGAHAQVQVQKFKKPVVTVPTKPIIERAEIQIKDAKPEASVVETRYTCPSVTVELKVENKGDWAVSGDGALGVVDRKIQSNNGFTYLNCFYGRDGNRLDRTSATIETDRSDRFCRLHPTSDNSFGCRPEEDWLNKKSDESFAPSYRVNLDHDPGTYVSQNPDVWWGDTREGGQMLAGEGRGKIALLRGEVPRRGTCSRATDTPVDSIPIAQLTPGTVVCYRTDKDRYGYLMVQSLTGGAVKTLNVTVKTFAKLD
ncbi:MAG: hypothetical protein WA989_05770 [Henriciella sp.]|uniref:hypothetical protein n=1 Tax=Henriciella sp. TaxID=1968823 RepID=UPI003C7378F6